MFPDLFDTIPLKETGFSIVEPPAGIMIGIYNRLQSVKDESGNINVPRWNAMYVFSALYYNGQPAIIGLAKEWFSYDLVTCDSINSLVDVYRNLSTEKFSELFDWIIDTKIPASKLESWFREMDDKFIITKKKADEEKND